MYCELCGDPMRFDPRARFCSTLCRVWSHRLESAIPGELRALPRWVRWSESKVPLTVAGVPASSVNPETWSDYRTAVAAARVGVGIGFVLNGDGIVCVDLDDCIADSGRVAKWARAIVDELGPTWVELSPSGRGLHIWGRGFLERGRRVGSVEIYGSGRYMTVTGRRMRGVPIALGDFGDVARILA